MTSISWSVEEVSVVILARDHNPSIINPDFLKENGIVGANWNLPFPPIITPAFTQINYENITWAIATDRCVIGEKVGGKFRDSYYLYECAKKYIEVLKHIPYTALGLNWQIVLGLKVNSSDWLKSKFLKDGDWTNKIFTIDLTLKLQPDSSSTCSLAVKIPPQGQNVILVDCNFHFGLQQEQERPKEMVKILSRSMHYQKILNGYLTKYFIGRGGTT